MFVFTEMSDRKLASQRTKKIFLLPSYYLVGRTSEAHTNAKIALLYLVLKLLLFYTLVKGFVTCPLIF